jgi:hypothetical protein
MKKTISSVFTETKKALARKRIVTRLLKAGIPGIETEELEDLLEKLTEDFSSSKEDLRTIISDEISTVAVSNAADNGLMRKKGTDHARRELTLAALLAADIVQILFPFENAKREVSGLILDRGHEMKFTETFVSKLHEMVLSLGIEITFNEGKNECFSYRKKVPKAA